MNTPPVLPEIQAIQEEMVALRHRIHANPELAYQEVATAELVAETVSKDLTRLEPKQIRRHLPERL